MGSYHLAAMTENFLRLRDWGRESRGFSTKVGFIFPLPTRRRLVKRETTYWSPWTTNIFRGKQATKMKSEQLKLKFREHYLVAMTYWITSCNSSSSFFCVWPILGSVLYIVFSFRSEPWFSCSPTVCTYKCFLLYTEFGLLAHYVVSLHTCLPWVDTPSPSPSQSQVRIAVSK